MLKRPSSPACSFSPSDRTLRWCRRGALQTLQQNPAARLVRPEDMRESVWISADPHWHAARLVELADLGFDEIHLHQVGRNQRDFINVFGRDVLPALRC
jgi:alkanesulfonate monooxygenase SsuD/methylene tetrahydromethanopterin reductase-like flavin-dependent oxidoreductase (luciferase family)